MKTTQSHTPKLPITRNRTLILIAVVAVITLAVLFILGFWIRHERVSKREKMAKETKNEAPIVQVVAPKKTQQSFDLTLPADVHPYAQTALYARTNGYLAVWHFDINDRVKRGDILAVISAPDTDAELEQAQAALQQQQTNHALATATDERFRGLIAIHGVTQEQLDQNKAAREQAGAGETSAGANVDRMKALVGFEKIVAPFDGVVTARNYDVGALISATNIGPGQEIFDLAQDDTLRVFVNIPQAYVSLIRFGEPVSLAFEQNFPGHRFAGTVTRATGLLDPQTRTLKTELEVKNNDPVGRLYPGMYGEAIFPIKRERAVLTIPTSALLFEAEGKEVAIVTNGDKIHFQKITPGSDFGTEIEVTDGLTGDERVVANPGEELTEGIQVKIAPPAKDEAKPGENQAKAGDPKRDGEQPKEDQKSS